jgi:hypothetical protein
MLAGRIGVICTNRANIDMAFVPPSATLVSIVDARM